MGEKTGIEWTHHTFNPWWGCEKISPGCANCYAAELAARFGTEWGPEAPRRFFGQKHWDEPLVWNRAAQKAGERRRVFCASMADVFEQRGDLDPVRPRLWELVMRTPALDWLLLTKRPENVRSMAPAAFSDHWPSNVWIGTTVENQEQAERRIPELLKIRADVRFLSCEPLLGRLDLERFLDTNESVAFPSPCRGSMVVRALSWVIVGGESGSHARPMHPDWARSLRDQCAARGVPFFFKQWGEWGSIDDVPDGVETVVPEGPLMRLAFAALMERVGKKAAGSLLDGANHKAFPGGLEKEPFPQARHRESAPDRAQGALFKPRGEA